MALLFVWYFAGALFVLTVPRSAEALSVSANFNQRGVRGSITFAQPSPSDDTNISVSLSGLEGLPGPEFPWHVHQYPFLQGILSPCAVGVTGGHYDPLGASDSANYTLDCAGDSALCEVGDLSGKFGPLNSNTASDPFTDPFLSLYGVYSVIGRSIVLHDENGTRLICANINYPDVESAEVEVLYSQFRDGFTGNIYFRQHSDESTSSVFVDLVRYSEPTPDSTGHNWHVHASPLQLSGDGSIDCVSAGPHYNPRGVDASGDDYAVLCNSTAHGNCEVGDLSSKSEPLSVRNGVTKLFYTDTDLPLIGGDISIVDRSVVIHDQNRTAERISCANITTFNPLEAVANFNENGVMGSIRFVQNTPFDETQVIVSLTGLRNRTEWFGIYESPTGSADSGSDRCGMQFTGVRYNPFGVESNGDNPFNTSDYLEVGDLSGKFGDLAARDDISETFADPNIPLFGSFNIIGRSIVICENNMVGSRWLCANIQHVRPVIRVTVTLNAANFTGLITFLQPADDSFAETTIVVEIDSFPLLPVIPGASSVTMVTTSFITPTPSLQPMSSQFRSTSFVLVPSSTPMSGSGTDCGSGIVPCDSSDAMVSPTPMARRKRTAAAAVKRKAVKRQTATEDMQFDWSLRVGGAGDIGTPGDCASLPLVGGTPPSSSQCSPAAPLACAGGDLTGKHGPLRPGGSRAVFTDPNLPLSGPMAVFGGSAVLLIQPLGATDADNAICQEPVVTTPTTMPTTTTATPTSTTPSAISVTVTPSSTPQPSTDNTVVIAAVVGAVGGALLLVAVVLIVIAIACYIRKTKSSEYKLGKRTELEMGTLHPAKPVLGVAHYRALHDFAPLSNGDLALTRGDWVTLIEAPYGGEWWRGKSGEREGWFPKNYIEFVDIEAEKRKIQEDNFKLAAAAIVAASSSFSAHHPSMARKPRLHDNKPPKRAHTLSKIDIDSTPKSVAKFNKPYLERNDTEAVVIENVAKEAESQTGSETGTPRSQRSAEIIMNKAALEAGSSQESYESSNSSNLPGLYTEPVTTPIFNGNILHIGTCIAKFDFSGSTDIELQLKKDDVIAIIEQADNGWCKGVCEGRVGWFPETYVRFEPTEQQASAQIELPKNMADSMSTGEELEVSEYRALYGYRSDTEGDLVLNEGETVLVYWSNESGWWFGSAGGNQGWFPCSYVEPIIDLSEAGSVSALSNQEGASALNESAPVVGGANEDREEVVGGFANEIAAAAQKRKARKSTSKERSSFKKKWSMKRKSKDKSSESEEQPATGVVDQQPRSGGESPALQGELAVALVRRNSLPRDRHLSIDDEMAVRREQKSGESEERLSKTELFSAFIRRSLKKKTSEAPSSSDNPPSSSVNPPSSSVREEPGSPLLDNQTPMAEGSVQDEELDDVFSEVPSRKPDQEQATQQVGTPTKLEETPTKVDKPEDMPAKDSVTTPSQKVSSRKSTLSKPRRHAPPPPANASPKLKTGTPPTTPPTSGVASKLRFETPPITPPTSVENKPQQSPLLQTVSEQPPSPLTTTSDKQSDGLNRAYTTAMGRPAVTRPKPPGVKQRRTTAASAALKSKPRRLPPPPPPHTQTPPTMHTKPVLATSAGEAQVQKPVAPPRTSIASVQIRPRVQRVKRPASRMIPPPPKIPLPPRPTKRQFSEADIGLYKPQVLPKSLSQRRQTGPPPVVPPRDYIPVAKRGPKPAPPTRSSSLSGRGHFKIRRTVSDVPEETQIEKSVQQTEAEEQQETIQPQNKEEISKLEEESKEVVSKERKSSTLSSLSKSRPPGRPPPPRPISAAVKPEDPIKPDPVKPVSEAGKTSSTRPSVSEEQAAAVESKTLFDITKQSEPEGATTRSGSFGIKSKSSSLMRSLKKMVGRSDSRKGSGEVVISYPTSRDDKPQRPPPPLSRESLKPQEQKDDVKTEAKPSQSPGSKLQSNADEDLSAVEQTRPNRPPPPVSTSSAKDSKRGSESSLQDKAPSPDPPAATSNGNSDLPPRKDENGDVVTQNGSKPVPVPRGSIDPPAHVAVETEPVEPISKPVPAPRKSSSPSPVFSPTSSDSKSPDTNFYRATGDYKALKDDEISFSEGDVLIIITPGSDGVFHYGMLDDGTTGLFPLSHVQPFFSKK